MSPTARTMRSSVFSGHNYDPAIGNGAKADAKADAWPELRGKSVVAVVKALKDIGERDVRIWGAEEKAQKPEKIGNDKTVWLYTTFKNIVYHIPQHGPWSHPNRASVGWPYLQGSLPDYACKEIYEEVIGVKIIIIQDIIFIPHKIDDSDDSWEVVKLEVGKDGTVENIPKIG